MAWSILEDRPLAGKFVVVGLIVVGLMIPLSMLRGLIAERSQMRNQAVATVAKGWGGCLTAGGPMLRIPFDVERKSRTGEISSESHQLFILADDLKVRATLDRTTTRRVGIYGVPVYLVHINLDANFKMSDVLAAAESGPYSSMTLHWKEARLRLPLSDVRSVREISSATVGQHSLTFGPGLSDGFPGVEAKIDLSEFLQHESLPFSAQLILAGSESVNFLPTAAKSTLELQSNWPDPQFQGAFLPSQYHIDAHGFQAQWQVLALNRAFAQSWVDTQVDSAQLAGAEFGVDLFQSVDVYQRSERAVKYALVFIALTFLSFLAWETLAQIAVHPVQYGLIGLALSTFYLLLIALAEHLPFWLSYWLGAAALIALLGVYIAGALDSVRSGAIIAVIMGLVYGLLFTLVLSESYSLLMGALALFAVLSTVMIATRRLRWGRKDPALSSPPGGVSIAS
jgi:inner membrane protein